MEAICLAEIRGIARGRADFSIVFEVEGGEEVVVYIRWNCQK